MPHGYWNIEKARLIGNYLGCVDDKYSFDLGKIVGCRLLASGNEKVLLGRDEEQLSKMIWHQFVDGLLESGISVADIGVTVTPVLDYSRTLICVPTSIMVCSNAESSFFSIVIGDKDELFTKGMTLDAMLLCENGYKDKITKIRSVTRGSYRSYDCSDFYLRMLEEKLVQFYSPLRIALSASSNLELSYAQDIISIMGGEPIIDDRIGSLCKSTELSAEPVQPLKELKNLVYREACNAGIHISHNGEHVKVLNVSGSPVDLDLKDAEDCDGITDTFCYIGRVLKQIEKSPFKVSARTDTDYDCLNDSVMFETVAG